MTFTTQLTKMEILKTDERGRVLVSREQRDALMVAFEQSRMSGAAFARLHGIKYSTFANWRKKRSRQECTPPLEPASLFEEISMESRDRTDGLTIDLPGGAKTCITRADQIPSVVALLKYLEVSC